MPATSSACHNHGQMQIGDVLSEGELLQFTGIPYFAPDLFRRARMRDPLKVKQLHKGLQQLGEEGAVQVFKPLVDGSLLIGRGRPVAVRSGASTPAKPNTAWMRCSSAPASHRALGDLS